MKVETYSFDSVWKSNSRPTLEGANTDCVGDVSSDHNRISAGIHLHWRSQKVKNSKRIDVEKFKNNMTKTAIRFHLNNEITTVSPPNNMHIFGSHSKMS